MPLEIDITLKNYRCFEDVHPVTLRLRDGVTAFVGKNNSGKSSLLKFLYECRPIFGAVASRTDIGTIFSGQQRPYPVQKMVSEPAALACDFNDRPVELVISYRND